MDSSSGQVTQLLIAWQQGDPKALEQLAPLVESELHGLAVAYLRRERPEHVLQATALVNEAYLHLIDAKAIDWNSRSHFFAVAATIMRRVLVSQARSRARIKRGSNPVFVSLAGVEVADRPASLDVIALDTALHKLSGFDARKSQIVEIRFFGGLSEEETAKVLSTSVRTVQREWNLARVWLFRELGGNSTYPAQPEG